MTRRSGLKKNLFIYYNVSTCAVVYHIFHHRISPQTELFYKITGKIIYTTTRTSLGSFFSSHCYCSRKMLFFYYYFYYFLIFFFLSFLHYFIHFISLDDEDDLGKLHHVYCSFMKSVSHTSLFLFRHDMMKFIFIFFFPFFSSSLTEVEVN